MMDGAGTPMAMDHGLMQQLFWKREVSVYRGQYFPQANGYEVNGHRFVMVAVGMWRGYNYLVDTPTGGHGTETSGRFRGVRAIEVYNNTFVWSLVRSKRPAPKRNNAPI